MTSRSRLDLQRTIQQLGGEPGVVICTYAFQADFFEDYCLERLSAVANSNNISVILDHGSYDDLLSGPTSEQPKYGNLRYLLSPISVSGVFHSKLLLFADEKRGTLILGSANFTQPGFTENAELVGCYYFEADKNEEYRSLFCAAFDFLQRLAAQSGKPILETNLNQLLVDAPWLALGTENWDDTAPYRFLHNLDTPLLDQLIKLNSGRAQRVLVLSRFFDQDPRFLDIVVSRLPSAKLQVYTQNCYTTMSPGWLSHPLVQSGKVEIYAAEFQDGEHLQPLHAKALCIDSDTDTWFFYGSANFTTPALLRTAQSGNVETGIAIRGKGREFRSATRLLFDPTGHAIRLRKPGDLVSMPVEPSVPKSQLPVWLMEAELHDKTVVIRAEMPDREFSEIFLRLELGPGTYDDLRVDQRRLPFTATVPEPLLARLGKRACVVRIVCDGQALSNPVLLLNLVDTETGENLRRQRNMRQAQQSAPQFLAVLSDLLKGNDEGALQTFLMFCNIPLALGARSPLRPRVDWNPRESMRTFEPSGGPRYSSLHNAVMFFVERHLRKLRKHTSLLDPQGIPNFLHIFLAIGGVLQAQMERVVQSVEAKEDLITVDEWAECRRFSDIYLRVFEDMTRVLGPQYVERLTHEYPASQIREQFAPDLAALQRIYADMLAFRSRIEKVRLLKCHRPKDTKPFSYFHSVLSDEGWGKYRKSVEGMYGRVESTISARGLPG